VIYIWATINIIACDLYLGNNQKLLLGITMRQQSKLLLVIYVVATIDIIACGILYAATTNTIDLNYIVTTINIIACKLYCGNNQ